MALDVSEIMLGERVRVIRSESVMTQDDLAA